jgi:peptidoglycan biosynthesis protein MviN/MurJ (putative lipid II flippase)
LGVCLALTPLAEAGLALAGAINAALTTVIYVIILHRRGSPGALHLRAAIVPLLASLLMVVVVHEILARLPPGGPRGHDHLLRLAVAVGVGAPLYGLCLLPMWLRRRQRRLAA